jgi:hypothetical protein
MTKAKRQVLLKPQVLERAKDMETGDKTVWITAGAGDIDQLVNPLTQLLLEK